MRYLRLMGGAAALALLATMPARGAEIWDELGPEIFGKRVIEAAAGEVVLTAPYRATDDREVPIAADVSLPPGQQIASLMLVIDGNPMPVSAIFELPPGRERFSVLVNMRLNGPSPVRAIVETTDGRLVMAEAMVKTSGLGACAAPPVSDADAALATLGQMEFLPAGGDTALAALGSAAAEGGGRGRLEIRHPSHSGLQMDQVTLLYMPARFVQALEVWEGEDPAFRMTGSISLSEDPEIEFSHDPARGPLRVRMTDTDGAVFERSFGIGGS